jgi:hypothetical protein
MTRELSNPGEPGRDFTVSPEEVQRFRQALERYANSVPPRSATVAVLTLVPHQTRAVDCGDRGTSAPLPIGGAW